MSTLLFPTVREDVPSGLVETLAAQARPNDYQYVDGRDVYTFPSPERFCAFAAAQLIAGPMRRGCYGSLNKCFKPEWFGACHETALWMGTVTGWAEAAQLALDVYDRLTAHRLMSRIPTMRYVDEPGEDIDVSAYLAGEDAVFTETALTDSVVRAGRSSVRVKHSLFASSGTDVDEIVTKGVASAAMVHLLEAAGVQVAVDLDMDWKGIYPRDSGRTGHLECRLKHYGEPTDLPRLVYWLAHPAALRRIWFAASSAYFDDGGLAPIHDEEDSIRIGDAIWNGNGAVEAIKTTLAKAGFELEAGR